MRKRDKANPEPEVISMEEYLAKRKKIRDRQKKRMPKKPDRSGEKGLTPLEFYMVSSLSWS